MSALSRSISDLQDNRRQWQAFQTEGHCVVLAPPGSGKTKLLTTRLAFDLLNKIPRPHGAACITLTNAAADELQRRTASLGIENRANLFIGTVHSFALRQIIEPFATLVGRPELATVQIAGDQQCKRAMKEAIETVYGAEDSRNVDSTIRVLRQRLTPPEEWASRAGKLTTTFYRYLEDLHAQGVYDFTELIGIAVDLVENHRTIRQVLAAKFPHLYIDEYQDLAPGLHRLVEALCFDHYANAELFAVGDADQAVYAWTGTRPELLDDLAGHSHVTPIELEFNYRSASAIIDVANRLRPPDRVPMKGFKQGGTVSVVYCPRGPAEQYEQVVEHVRAAMQDGVPLHEIAVLCSTNAECATVTKLLRESNIPAAVREPIYRTTAVTALLECCAAWATLGREQSGDRLDDLLTRWRSVLGDVWTMHHSIELTTVLMEYGSRPTQPASDLIDAILHAGLSKALDQAARADEVNEFQKMHAALTTGELKGSSTLALAERSRKSGRVEVTTMTSSKGLEFDVVMIVGLDEQNIPSYQALRDTTQMAEDRRKLYVSITRARDAAALFYSGFVLKPWGDRYDAGPSRFLREAGLI